MDRPVPDDWIDRLNNGDLEAVGPIFEAYEPYLRLAIRRRLSTRLRSRVDSGDIVQAAFADILRGVRDGHWRFNGRPQLVALLHKIARRRLADRYHRDGPALAREASLDETPSRSLPHATQPRPSQEAQGREFWERVLQACPPVHHEVVRLRMNGLRMGEIAARTGLHEGSVRRVLYELARRLAIAPRSATNPTGDVG